MAKDPDKDEARGKKTGIRKIGTGKEKNLTKTLLSSATD